MRTPVWAILVFASCLMAPQPALRAGDPWRRHTIDASSRGADGVRLADVNGDGRMDLTTGWEEGGLVRVYLNPGPLKASASWPAVTVGRVRSPEDAVFADMDGDGAVDVVSSCEGRTRSMFVHWAPKNRAHYLDAKQWRTETIPSTQGAQSWMFAVPADLDARGNLDLIVGSKGGGGAVGMILTSDRPRDVASWRYVKLCSAGWIMSLRLHDFDADGDLDVLFSDRKQGDRGVWWLENPGAEAVVEEASWRRHLIGGREFELMFLDFADLDGDGQSEVVTATRNGRILVHRRGQNGDWAQREIMNPLQLPNGKAVRAADIDLDGRIDLVHTANNGGRREHRGAVWMRYRNSPDDPRWNVFDISGERGVKFDLIQLLDLDEDGDLDVVTCEERDNLGVFWYENPTRNRSSQAP